MKAKLENGYLVWKCPGCEDTHCVPVSGERAWGFNGSTTSPTLTPSVKVTWMGLEDGNRKHKVCHFFLTGGKVNFCADCTHSLNGQQNVELPDYA